MIDLGDDVYTRGRPHPMIDPSAAHRADSRSLQRPRERGPPLGRSAWLRLQPRPGGDARTSLLPMGLPTPRGGRDLAVVASVCGTEQDPQVLSAQTLALEQAGVTVMPSNAAAVRHA